MCLAQVSLDLDFWSDTSDVGWGAHLGPEVVSGLWSPDEVGVSINTRKLLAVERGLLHFQSSLRGSTVAIYVDNSMAVAYLRKSWGTRSLFLNEIAQRILRWSELHAVTLAPQFIPGCRNVLADSLSRPHQILGSEWTLHAEVFRDLSRQWPVMVDLFATSVNHRCSVISVPSRILSQRGQMHFSSRRTVFWPTHSLLGPSFLRSWRSCALLGGPF